MKVATAPASPAVQKAATRILRAFDDYNAAFADISRRGRRRFEAGDRAGMQADAMERVQLYDDSIRECLALLETELGSRILSRTFWKALRNHYRELIEELPDSELCKTFFNSSSRRLFRTRGVDGAVEFRALEVEPSTRSSEPPAIHHFAIPDSSQNELHRLWDRVLASLPFRLAWGDRPGDVDRLARRLGRVLEDDDKGWPVAMEFMDTVFYRDGRAWLVGRLFTEKDYRPCVVVLNRHADGIRAEALLIDRRSLSIAFGYTHNYFLADLPRVSDATLFLRTLLPHKPLDELYTVLGRIKQGKTERYRHFFRHLNAHADEKLELAEGTPGLVMVVFTLPSYPLVFKVVRDRFGPEKPFKREQVFKQYQMVFRHERGGRLVDAQPFRELRFPLRQMSEALLKELQSDCQQSIRIDGDSLIVNHCYAERRVRPLNLYLREAGPQEQAAVLSDYGQALEDLSCADIFPGDLLLKNFGVTGTGRVIFYDYDELRLLRHCHFRRIPPARSEEELMSAEPGFAVNPGDVFPERFPDFMGLSTEQLDVIRLHHAHIFDAAWWRDQREKVMAGGVDHPPYPLGCRLV
ncbi:bifunctional isocitrate dehydrogenase kinase/phosphatase [Natronospira bacteriovora]|uniref:Isocitrate dehydrogenase kinase/phosphatase n=1 Tax=Natronospira bacteriovora TaxID=3069753 RepID=A0ABU0W8H1_9GAMM|nr:bifunctional isocitrate dehydrogenase kinase/phosphatase [Natronospira sp. AB-CW4]MDQ2070048.1 bifunctional isocitrate dehydrogenase kinase/phosphatase [Natronospira sp. AB-CW4]